MIELEDEFDPGERLWVIPQGLTTETIIDRFMGLCPNMEKVNGKWQVKKESQG